MDQGIPLGKRESQHLEFRAADALEKPLSISREVVGMLNASGGEVWIGLREEDGIAVKVEGIPDSNQARISLLDHLTEVVEPRLHPDEVVVEVQRFKGKSLILLKVSGTLARGPFAQLAHGGRVFTLRSGHRSRPMTHEEIFGGADRAAQQSSGLIQRRNAITRCDEAGMWVAVEASPATSLDIQGAGLPGLLQSPPLTGNREAGWNFRLSPLAGEAPHLEAGALEYGGNNTKRTTIWANGIMELWIPIRNLHHGLGQGTELHPLALLEYPISLMRLAREIFRSVSESRPTSVRVDTALMNAPEWALPSFPPGTYGNLFEHEAPKHLDEGSFMLPTPFEFPWDDFEEYPDRAGYMLVRAIYEAFGLPAERIPAEYDRRNKRLTLSE